MEKEFKLIHILSGVILLLSIISSAGGLFIDDLYRDNEFLKVVWKTTDLMILIIGMPVFFIALVYSTRGSFRADLILLGMLDFTLYNYGYYLFAVSFNWFFLLYVAIYVLSATTIIIALLKLNVKNIAQQFRKKTPVKLIAGFMLFVSVALAAVYTMMTVGFIATGEIPVIVERSEHPTNVVFAMDLSLVVPIFALGGVWLWKRKPWGYILATISMVKSAVYNLILCVITVAVARNVYSDAYSELPLWIFLTFASLIGIFLLVSNLQPKNILKN